MPATHKGKVSKDDGEVKKVHNNQYLTVSYLKRVPDTLLTNLLRQRLRSLKVNELLTKAVGGYVIEPLV